MAGTLAERDAELAAIGAALERAFPFVSCGSCSSPSFAMGSTVPTRNENHRSPR